MPEPNRILIDTNLLIRLLILDYSTPLSFFTWLGELGVELWTIPLQQDETRRNLRSVYEVHAAQWKSNATSARDALNAAARTLRQLAALGVECEPARTALNEAKQRADGLAFELKPWRGLYELAETVFATAVMPEPEQIEEIMKRASGRVDLWNPPCGRKKGGEHPAKRPLGDSAIWELVLHVLQSTPNDESVWFATADTDFRHSKTTEIHPFLELECKAIDPNARFTFLAESGGTYEGDRPFAVVAAIKDQLPDPLPAGVDDATEISSSLTEDPFLGLKRKWEEQTRPWKRMQRLLEEQARPFREMQRRIEDQTRPFREMQRRLEEQARPFRDMQRRFEEQTRPFQEMQRRLEDQARPFREMQRRLSEQAKMLDLSDSSTAENDQPPAPSTD